MGLLFWKKKEQPSPEQRRHEKDVERLAEYQAFDNAVGSLPTQGTLRGRFRDAVYDGFTEVVKDTLRKGLEVPNELSFAFSFVRKDGTLSHDASKTLDVAARREWADIVDVLVPHVDQANLDEALSTAEFQKNAPIAKAIKAEISKRAAADAPDQKKSKSFSSAVLKDLM